MFPSIDIRFILATVIDISNYGSSSYTAKKAKARIPEREHFEDTDKRPDGLRHQIQKGFRVSLSCPGTPVCAKKHNWRDSLHFQLNPSFRYEPPRSDQISQLVR